MKPNLRSKTMDYFIFNGDTDGICATRQLLFSNQNETKFVTGVKRDIALLDKIQDLADQEIVVLDVSVEKNHPSLIKLLKQNCRINWYDHHISAKIPEHIRFINHINTDPDINTSQIVNLHLNNKYPDWAIVGLFGDNMTNSADELAQSIFLSEVDKESIKQMGELFNYNAYGEDLDDLHYHPEEVLKECLKVDHPLDLLSNSDIIEKLKTGYQSDLSEASKAKLLQNNTYVFPNQKWGRRVIGVFANLKANQNPDQPTAILIEKEDHFVVSVRSPINKSLNAAQFCAKFPTGGGRKKAGGINELPKNLLNQFIDELNSFFK